MKFFDAFDKFMTVVAGGFLVCTAIGSWVIFVIAMNATGVGAAVYFGFAGLTAVVGSAACFFGVDKEDRKKQRWLRLCTYSNYSALGVLITLFIVGMLITVLP